MANLYDLPLDWVDAYKGLIDDVFSQFPDSEAVSKVISEVLPTAEKVLNPLQYEKVKEYADAVIRDVRRSSSLSV